ncbi:MAG: hypothetical protein IE917_20095 [Betaproteobacteria bacterium]|nr:hypothetical protein [Betaproteobacteria bacterium]
MRSLRKRLTFRAVNRKGCADYDPGLQRHHLLPRQLLRVRAFTPLFDAVSHERLHFDDFRTNGLLLPARSNACVRAAAGHWCGNRRNAAARAIPRQTKG